jgi:predicted metal-binding membrane protein
MGPVVAASGPRWLFRLRSGQLLVLGLLLGLALVAWIFTDLRMAGMDAGPGTDPGAFGFYISTWVVMMAGMMFPSIAPMVLMFRRLERGRGGSARWLGTTELFVLGYLAVWAASGLVAYTVLKAGRAWLGDAFAWNAAGRWTATGVLLAAALYEFTPLKHACLKRCRSPLGFLMGSWRDGRAGAVTMGMEHGAWCLGCCWALMAALFALGAMSLTWMLVIAALISAEKLLPWRTASATAVAVLLAALAVGVAAAPSRVPALTVPGSSTAMKAMSHMGSMEGTSHMGAMNSKSRPDGMKTMPATKANMH